MTSGTSAWITRTLQDESYIRAQNIQLAQTRRGNGLHNLLFTLAMNMIAKSAEVKCGGPKTKSDTRQPPIRAFMDYLAIPTPSAPPGAIWNLQGLVIRWARKGFKPSKCRVVEKICFTLAGDIIPFIYEQLVKSLGKVFDPSLKESIKKTSKELVDLLKADKPGLPHRFSVWIY